MLYDLGWEYCIDPSQGNWIRVMESFHRFRRRRFVRTRIVEHKREDQVDTAVKQVTPTEGWEYSKMFGKKFHRKAKKSDLVRRRKWRRKTVNVDPRAPASFSVPTSKKTTIMHPPSIALYFESKLLNEKIYLCYGIFSIIWCFIINTWESL